MALPVKTGNWRNRDPWNEEEFWYPFWLSLEVVVKVVGSARVTLGWEMERNETVEEMIRIGWEVGRGFCGRGACEIWRIVAMMRRLFEVR